MDVIAVRRAAVPGDAAGAARRSIALAKYAAFGIVAARHPERARGHPDPDRAHPAPPGHRLRLRQGSSPTEVGYVFYIDPGPVPGMNTAYWGPEIRVGMPQPALNTDMDAAHERRVAQLHASTRSDKELPVVFIQEPRDKAPIPIPIPDITPLNPPLGADPAAAAEARRPQRHGQAEPARGGDARARLRRHSTPTRSSGTGSLDVLALRAACCRSRQLVGVRGAGDGFDGLYYVKR